MIGDGGVWKLILETGSYDRFDFCGVLYELGLVNPKFQPVVIYFDNYYW